MTVWQHFIIVAGKQWPQRHLIFIFLNAIQVTYSLCRTIPALFLIIPEKYVFYTATVYISDKNQVKKNSVIVSQPLCVYTCT